MTEQSSNTKSNTTIEDKIDEVNDKLTQNSLAWEMLREQKTTIKRLFTVIFVLIFLWFGTVVGFGLYLNQFNFSDEIEQSIEATQEGDNNTVNGGDIYGIPKD